MESEGLSVARIIKEFISIQTMSVLQKPRDESFQARAIGLNLVGHRPIRSRGGYSNGPGLNATFRIRMPTLSTTRPLVVVCLVTNELINNWQLRHASIHGSPAAVPD